MVTSGSMTRSTLVVKYLRYHLFNRSNMTTYMTYPWMSYAAAHAYEAEASRHGVSTVARSSKGFMREYERAGSARAMASRPLPAGVTLVDIFCGRLQRGFHPPVVSTTLGASVA